MTFVATSSMACDEKYFTFVSSAATFSYPKLIKRQKTLLLLFT